MYRLSNIIRNFLLITISIIAISSCTPLSKLKYLQKTNQTAGDTIFTKKQNYILQTGDNLYIDIKTTNPEMRSLITGRSESNNISSANATPTSLYVMSYQINDNWDIQLPLVGTLNCKDQTCETLKERIEVELKKYITDAVVSVKLVNMNITVLGEVMRPGQFYINQKNTNLLDAIGMAGDLTAYGNRRNITVMRKLQSGDFKSFKLDLTKADVITHEAFYLMPNDIVYIEPMGTKPFGLATFPYSTIFSAITTIILTLTFIKN